MQREDARCSEGRLRAPRRTAGTAWCRWSASPVMALVITQATTRTHGKRKGHARLSFCVGRDTSIAPVTRNSTWLREDSMRGDSAQRPVGAARCGAFPHLCVPHFSTLVKQKATKAERESGRRRAALGENQFRIALPLGRSLIRYNAGMRQNIPALVSRNETQPAPQNPPPAVSCRSNMRIMRRRKPLSPPSPRGASRSPSRCRTTPRH